MLKESNLISKNTGVKDNKSMFLDKLLSIVDASDPIRKNETIKDTKKYLETGDLSNKILILIKYLKT